MTIAKYLLISISELFNIFSTSARPVTTTLLPIIHLCLRGIRLAAISCA
jgi:hypothetical protein